MTYPISNFPLGNITASSELIDVEENRPKNEQFSIKGLRFKCQEFEDSSTVDKSDYLV
jgi:hypothetical protein